MKTLTIQVEDNGRVAKKVFPLEPFQLLTPAVAAEGFLITVRQLQEEAGKPAPAKEEPPASGMTPEQKAAYDFEAKRNQHRGGKNKKPVDAVAK